MRQSDTSMGGGHRAFPSTSWSMILQARGPSSREHLERLIRRYWKPVYVFIRNLGTRGVEEAKDLTQEFFARLVEKDQVDGLDPSKGSFRGFLRKSVRNFVVDAARREGARRPRGGSLLLPFDEVRDEGPSEADPESRFDREWDHEVLAGSIAEMEKRLKSEGLAPYVRTFRAYCLPEGEEPRRTHREIAEELGISESAVRKRLTHCADRLREIVRARVREYVAEESEVEGELKRILRP